MLFLVVVFNTACDRFHSRFAATSSSAARRSACSARSADMSDWCPSAWSLSCARNAATSASSAARTALAAAAAAAAAVDEDDGDEADGLGLACSAAADALSGSLSGDAGDLEADLSGRPRGVEAALRLAEDDGDDSGEERDGDPDAVCPGPARLAALRRRGLGSVVGMESKIFHVFLL